MLLLSFFLILVPFSSSLPSLYERAVLPRIFFSSFFFVVAWVVRLFTFSSFFVVFIFFCFLFDRRLWQGGFFSFLPFFFSPFLTYFIDTRISIIKHSQWVIVITTHISLSLPQCRAEIRFRRFKDLLWRENNALVLYLRIRLLLYIQKKLRFSYRRVKEKKDLIIIVL